MLKSTHCEGDGASGESNLYDKTQMATTKMEHVPGGRVEAFL